MGGKTSTSTQTVSIPPEVMARYNAVNARAEQVAATPFQAYGGQFVAPINPTQQAGIQATGAASQLAQPFYGAATGLTMAGAQDVGPLTRGQIGYYESPYTEAVAMPTYAALRQQQQQELAQQQAGAIRSGAAFGERSGLERANLMRQQALGTAQALAPIYQQGYGQAVQTAAGQQGVVAQDLARRMQAGQQIAGLGTGAQQAALQGAQAQIGAGTLEQQTQQADLTARYQQFLQERGYPFQVAQFLANIAMGTGALSGSTTTTTQPQPFFSDRRLKHDVKPIGKTNDGLPIYAFKYNGSDQTQIGLMAQDVEKRKPEAVGLAAGFKTVDYEKATEGSERKHRFFGGETTNGDDMASMGGAVSLGDAGEAFARGGYAVGGSGTLLDPTDLRSILAAQQQSFGPFSQAGLYGGQSSDGSPMGAKSYVPKASLPTPKLMTAGAAPRAPQSGFAEAMQGMKDVQGLTTGLSDLGSAAKRVAYGAPAVTKDGKEVEPAKGGLIGTGGKSGGGLFNPKSPNDVPVEKSGVALPVSEANTASDAAASPGFMDRFKSMFGMERGGIVPSHHRLGYAGLGKVIDPFEAQDPTKGVNAYIEDATEDQTDNKLNPPGGGGGSGGGGGLGNAIGTAAAAANLGKMIFSMLPSDARLKDNIRRVGKTNDGQNIYAYDMGDGKTQLGLMAQEVLKRKPEAVGQRNGYLTLDYDKATEDAVKRAHGGLVPRHAAQAGGPQEGGMSEEEFNRTMQRAAEVTRMKESGNKYDIVGKPIPSGAYAGDRAYGAYQVMGKNVGPWTEEALGRRMTPEEFLEDRDAQDAVFYHKWGGNLRRYGNVPDAVSMWASGRPLAGNTTRDLVSGVPTSGYVANFMKAYDPNSPLASAEESRGVAGPAQKSFAMQYLPTKRNERGEEEVNVKQMVIPALVGLGAMASSPSRFLGSAVLQGLGAGAQSYAALERQQADIDSTKASTFETMQRAANLAFTPDGKFVRLEDGSLMPVWEWFSSKTRPMTIGGPQTASAAAAFLERIGISSKSSPVKSIGGEGAAAATGALSTPPTPGAPPAPGEKPAQVSEAPQPEGGAKGLPTYTPIGSSSKELAKGEAGNIMGWNAEGARAASNNYMATTQSMAQAANQNVRNINELANIVSKQIAAGGIGASGTGFVARAELVRALNFFGNALGGKESFNEADSRADLLRKLNNLQGAEMAKGADQRSLGALTAMVEALPQGRMSREAQAQLTSQIMVANQAAKDREVHRIGYGQLNPGINAYSNAGQAFENDNQARLTLEQELMKKAILTKPNAVGMLTTGKATPQQIEEFFQQLAKESKLQYVPGMYRYFPRQ